MDDDVMGIFQEHEEKVQTGKISTFCIAINGIGLLFQAECAEADGKQVPLSQELRSSLHTFFHDTSSIAYSSLDYITLKSLINAHLCINRMMKGG